MNKPKRKPNRHHASYDYFQPGSYFGDVVDGVMVLNDMGRIAAQQWKWMGNHFPEIHLDEWIIMPNHIHGIIFIDYLDIKNTICTDNPRVVPSRKPIHTTAYKRRHAILPRVLCAFKTTSSKLIRLNGTSDFAWHRSYHDHIIRTDPALNNIRAYIRNNPMAWHRDRNNPS